MKTENYFRGIDKIHTESYETYLRREARKRGISPDELETGLIIEPLAIAFSNYGWGELEVNKSLSTIVEPYTAIVDAKLSFYLEHVIPLINLIYGNDNKVLFQGTGVKEE